jgi:hypothetical protein
MRPAAQSLRGVGAATMRNVLFAGAFRVGIHRAFEQVREADMKKALIVTAGLVLGSAAFLMAQQAATSQPQVMGRGRGGAPYAWNDKDKDGICDVTGKPVGQGRSAGFGRGCGGRGRGAYAGWGRGMGRGGGRGYGMQQQQAAPAPTQK